MKKIILAIALAVAAMPLTFAAQTPANPPAKSAAAKTRTSTVKKHKKHARKSTAKKSGGTGISK
jgi:opacity protein-like surface antigen